MRLPKIVSFSKLLSFLLLPIIRTLQRPNFYLLIVSFEFWIIFTHKEFQGGLYLDRWRDPMTIARWSQITTQPSDQSLLKSNGQSQPNIFLVLFLLPQEFCLHSRTQPLSLSLSKSESSRSSSLAKAVRRWILYLRSEELLLRRSVLSWFRRIDWRVWPRNLGATFSRSCLFSVLKRVWILGVLVWISEWYVTVSSE